MTSITFETATIADAIKKAARIAPGKAGYAFDKASGIILDIYPNDDIKCVVRATNLDVFHTEAISCVEASGNSVRWRLPSQLVAATVGSLPIGSGKTVKFEQDGSKVRISSGRMRATMVLADPEYYPDWDMFDGSGMTVVSGLGGKIAQVEWAASPHNDPPLCGIFFDGESIVATDRFRLARVPCEFSIPRSIVVPSGILGNILKQMGETGVAVSGNLFQLAPDNYTQIQTVIFDATYPNLKPVLRTDYEEEVEFRKDDMIDKLNRANQFSGADRTPLLKMFLGKEEIAVMMQNSEIGLLGDVVECPGQITHKRVEFGFTPKNIIDAIAKAPNDKVKIKYDPNDASRIVYVDGGSGYEAWIKPRVEVHPNI